MDSGRTRATATAENSSEIVDKASKLKEIIASFTQHVKALSINLFYHNTIQKSNTYHGSESVEDSL